MIQAELVEKSDLGSWKYIGTVENAGTNIPLTNVIKLADGLGVTIAEPIKACFPPDRKRKEQLHDLLALEYQTPCEVEAEWIARNAA
ncbi:MAG TPA: helix-turn-helix transcriptional regulator [bacterium]|nr:helix-turn-helix transcriptional regulator [bacterium]